MALMAFTSLQEIFCPYNVCDGETFMPYVAIVAVVADIAIIVSVIAPIAVVVVMILRRLVVL